MTNKNIVSIVVKSMEPVIAARGYQTNDSLTP